MNRELVFLRAFAGITAIGMILITTTAFKKSENQKFGVIDVERINIVEKDGTVKMLITNTANFPNGNDRINNRPTNEGREKRTGILFFNEDGIECGGFIYDGKKTENGHASALSLTYDQYDGDQVMQLLTQDEGQGDKRVVSSTLAFIDQASKESQIKMFEIAKELDKLREKDPKAMEEKYKQYEKQGLIGGAPRVLLGKLKNQKNGLFLFDDKGMTRAMFYVDKENNAKLDFFDEKGNTIASFPEKKS